MTETSVEDPRLARREEFPAILDLVDRCFNHDEGGMIASNPRCYDRSHPERHAVVVRDGEVVSHVACIPDTQVVGDATLACWGVSGVATDPRHRGDGYMSRLVRFWLDRADDRAVPLLKLWGYRDRYGRFGWETAGGDVRYRITRDSFADPPDADERVSAYDGSEAALDRIVAAHRTMPYRVERDREAHRTVLGQRGLRTLVYDGSAGDAYLSFSSSGREKTVEEVAGSAGGVRALLGHLLRAFYTTEVACFVHPRDPLNGTLVDVSKDWGTRSHKELNVRRLAPTLEAFAGQMERRWNGDAGSLTLGLRSDDGPTDAARIDYSAADVTVEPADGDPDLVLDRRAMTRCLFGHPRGVRTAETDHPFLAATCPLSFYVPRTEWV